MTDKPLLPSAVAFREAHERVVGKVRKSFRDNLSFVVIPVGTPQVAQSFYEKSHALNSLT